MEVKVLKEDIVTSDVLKKEMTSDCHFVHLDNGSIDIARGHSMVKIFDYYHDKGKKVTCIEVAGGQLNPKLQEPIIGKDK